MVFPFPVHFQNVNVLLYWQLVAVMGLDDVVKLYYSCGNNHNSTTEYNAPHLLFPISEMRCGEWKNTLEYALMHFKMTLVAYNVIRKEISACVPFPAQQTRKPSSCLVVRVCTWYIFSIFSIQKRLSRGFLLIWTLFAFSTIHSYICFHFHLTHSSHKYSFPRLTTTMSIIWSLSSSSTTTTSVYMCMLCYMYSILIIKLGNSETRMNDSDNSAVSSKMPMLMPHNFLLSSPFWLAMTCFSYFQLSSR